MDRNYDEDGGLSEAGLARLYAIEEAARRVIDAENELTTHGYAPTLRDDLQALADAVGVELESDEISNATRFSLAENGILHENIDGRANESYAGVLQRPVVTRHHLASIRRTSRPSRENLVALEKATKGEE